MKQLKSLNLQSNLVTDIAVFSAQCNILDVQLMNNPKPVDSTLSSYSIIKYYSTINADHVLAH